jgi:hypothetical protein
MTVRDRPRLRLDVNLPDLAKMRAEPCVDYVLTLVSCIASGIQRFAFADPPIIQLSCALAAARSSSNARRTMVPIDSSTLSAFLTLTL